jgi:cell division protein FtsL
MTPPTAAARIEEAPAPGVRRAPAPRVPRRVSGPAPAAPGAARESGAGLSPTAEAAALRLRSVLDAPFLDRLTRGRMWIGLVAAALIGIVFMQVSLLRLNAGIGRSVQKAQTLERQNAQLRDAVARLGSNDRIQEAARRRGMILPKAGTFRYLMAGRRPDVDRALRMIKPPLNPVPTPASVTGFGGVAAASSGAQSTATATPTTTATPTVPQTQAPPAAAAPATSTTAAAPVPTPVAVAQPAPGQQTTTAPSIAARATR